MITVRKRIMLLLSALVVGFLAAIFAWRMLVVNRAEFLGRLTKQQRLAAIEKLVKMQENSLQVFAADYTAWDDMVQLTRTKDPKWAEENLAVSLATYNASGLWVYDRSLSLIYHSARLPKSTVPGALLSRAALHRLAKDGPFYHFFIQTPAGVLEIRGATIHRTTDTVRKGPSFGFFFVSRLWDRAYLAGLNELTGCKATLQRPVQDRTVRQVGDKIEYKQELRDWSGAPLTFLYLHDDLHIQEYYIDPVHQVSVLISLFMLFLMGLLFVCLFRWVSQPLRTLSASLESEDLSVLTGLERTPTEFGALAGLIHRFFEQRAALIRENGERRRTEEELANAAQELRLRNEELAEARDAALKAAQLKSEFLANTSHEIRTPLNGVIGMIDILLATPLNTEQQFYARTLKVSSQTLLAIINDILDFSKIEAGKLTIEQVAFSLRETLEEVAAVFASKAQQKSLELCCVLPPALTAPDVPANHLLGDPGRLRQILSNLIDNAIKFTPAGGEVVLGAELLIESSTQAQWRLSVRDTGIGIPPDRQQLIFESFTQADGSTTRRYGGTGLGLTISRQLVQLMGGEIGVTSVTGQGSTFWVKVPLQKLGRGNGASAGMEGALDAKRPTSNAVLQITGGTELRILVAEDNPVNQLVAMGLLQQCGVPRESVTMVADGRETLEALAAGSYDLLLLDVQMPEMDGLEVARTHRRQEQERGAAPLLIIAMTAHAMTGDRERCLEAGMDDYLSKPLEKDQIQAVLNRWIPTLSLGQPAA